MKPQYDDDRTVTKPWRGATGASTAHDTDRHNLEIIRKDQRLQRILTAYRTLDEAGRERLASMADMLRVAEGSDAA